MEEEIKEFEKRMMDVVSEMRKAIGAKSLNVDVRVDNYEKGCKIDVTYFTSIPQDATQLPGCKGD